MLLVTIYYFLSYFLYDYFHYTLGGIYREEKGTKPKAQVMAKLEGEIQYKKKDQGSGLFVYSFTKFLIALFDSTISSSNELVFCVSTPMDSVKNSSDEEVSSKIVV